MANWFTQLYGVTRVETPLHSQFHDGLLCPTTGMVEALRLELYSEEVNYYGLLISVKKKPVARFYRVEDNKEIEPRYWTTDMRAVHDTAIKGNPVKSRSRLSLWGRIVLVLLLALLCLCTYTILQWTGTIPPADTLDSLLPIDSIPSSLDSTTNNANGTL